MSYEVSEPFLPPERGTEFVGAREALRDNAAGLGAHADPVTADRGLLLAAKQTIAPDIEPGAMGQKLPFCPSPTTMTNLPTNR